MEDLNSPSRERPQPGHARIIFWDLLTFEKLLTGPVVHIIYWCGLAVIALMGFAANVIARMLNKARWIGYLGLLVIVYVAGHMIWEGHRSTVIDLTGKQEDPLSVADGYQPIRHRLGFAYEDDCFSFGLTWRRDYAQTGDARRGNSFLLSFSLKNLGR